jgi:hypothetical protein
VSTAIATLAHNPTVPRTPTATDRTRGVENATDKSKNIFFFSFFSFLSLSNVICRRFFLVLSLVCVWEIAVDVAHQ